MFVLQLLDMHVLQLPAGRRPGPRGLQRPNGLSRMWEPNPGMPSDLCTRCWAFGHLPGNAPPFSGLSPTSAPSALVGQALVGQQLLRGLAGVASLVGAASLVSGQKVGLHSEQWA